MNEIKKRRSKAVDVKQVTPRRKRKTEVVDAVQPEKSVDWEALAKNLQEALESSIAENAVLYSDNCALVKDNKSLVAIVAYLESRLARTNNPV